MKNLLSLLAVFVMAIGSAWADEVTFTVNSFTYSGNVATATENGVTMTLTNNNGGKITSNGTRFSFDEGTCTIEISIADKDKVVYNVVASSESESEAIYGKGPWTFEIQTGQLKLLDHISSFKVTYYEKRTCADLVAAMDGNIFENKDDATCYIYLNEENTVCLNYTNDGEEYTMYWDISPSGSYYLIYNDGICLIDEDGVVFVFTLGDNGKVTSISEGEDSVFFPRAKTPTGLNAVGAIEKNPVVKTVENGRVVIIRDGEKYDVAGRKL